MADRQREYREQNPQKVAESMKKWQQENPEKFLRSKRLWALTSKYGMTREQAEAFLVKTDHRCEICDAELTFGKGNKCVAPDHDHVTGEFRGVLCQACNSAIGLMQDDLSILQSAVCYLRRSRIRKVS